jgi:hypothetical protein
MDTKGYEMMVHLVPITYTACIGHPVDDLKGLWLPVIFFPSLLKKLII